MVIDAVIKLFENLVILAGQGISVLGNVIALPGIIGVVFGALAFWIAWRKTKSILGSALWLAGSLFIIFVMSSYIFFPFLFKGAENSLTSCYKAAGSNQKAIAVCDSISGGFVGSVSAQTQAHAQPLIVVEPVEVNPKQYTRTFKENALELLVQGWNLTPPEYPSSLPNQLVGPGDIPAGLTISFDCQNQISSLKNEIWNINIAGTVPGVGQKSLDLMSNGYFARDERGFGAKPNTTLVGTGTWEKTCPHCYVDNEVLQPTPTPQPTPVAPAVTKVPFPAVICGYWGYFYQAGAWLVVPTTGGQPDYNNATSVANATQDIGVRCPGETLPATP